MGHHELQGAKAMTVDSRDLLTRPLQLYCSMLANIRLDHFRLDESRTSRMVDLMKLNATEQHVVGKPTGREAGQKTAGDAGKSEDSPLDTEAAPADSELQQDNESSDIPSTSSSSSDRSGEGMDEDPVKFIPGPV